MSEETVYQCDICYKKTSHRTTNHYHEVDWHGDMTGWGLGSNKTEGKVLMCNGCYNNFRKLIKEGKRLILLEAENQKLKKAIVGIRKALERLE